MTSLVDTNDTPSLPCWKGTQEAIWNLQNKTPFKDGVFIGSMKAHQNPNGGPPRPKLDQNKLGR